MKNIIQSICLTVFISHSAVSQINLYYVYLDNVPYLNGSNVTLNCGVQNIQVQACFSNGLGGCVSAQCPNTISLPLNWSSGNTSNNGCSVAVTTDATTGGRIAITAKEGGKDYPFYLDIVRPIPPSPSILGLSNPTILCNGQSQNATAGFTAFTSYYQWGSDGSTQVSPYGNVSSNAMVTTTGIGKVKVKAIADPATGCPNSDWTSINVYSTPIISSKTVNGSAAQPTNYTGSSPTLNVYTNNSANNCTWSIVNGSGFLSSNGFTCGASIYGSFLQVKAQTGNNCGNGESYTFYLVKNSYRMASPNPVKAGTAIRVEFDDKKAAEATVESMVLYNEKQKIVWSLDKTEAQNYFKEKTYFDIETKGIPSGTYYLHLQIADKKQIERLIIE